MTTGKAIDLTTHAFVGKAMSLLLNMSLRFCHSFSLKEEVSFNFVAAVTIWVPKSSTVILEPKKIKSATVSTVSHVFVMK